MIVKKRTRKRTKKGIEPLVATVLIIGFTIVLAALVMKWTGTLFTQVTTTNAEDSQVAITCTSDIHFEVRDACIDGNKIKLLLQNEGTQAITGFIFQVIGEEFQTTNSLTGLSTYASQYFSANYTSVPYTSLPGQVQRVKIFPQIPVDGQQQTCTEVNYVPVNLHTCVDSNTIGLWSFENTPQDASTNHHDGTANGVPVYARGVLGNAMQFDGLNDYVNTTFTLPVSSFTVEFWVNSTDSSSTFDHPFSMGQFSTVYLTAPPAQNFVLKFFGSGSDFTLGPYVVDRWYHVKVTWDGTSARAYVNGQLLTPIPRTGSLAYVNNNLIIGNFQPAGGNWFEGAIDEFKLSTGVY